MTREEKLKQLQADKAALTIVTDGQPLIEQLTAKIQELKDLLGAGVDVNVDDLVEQVAKVQTLAPAVQELRKAIAEIDMPDIPKGIQVLGLDPIVTAINKHVRHIQQLQSYKVPDTKVLVEIVDNQKIEEVTKRLDKVIKAVEANSLVQTVDNYTPVRRVRAVGSKLFWDDDRWGGGGGGGAATHNSWLHVSLYTVNATPQKVTSSAGAFGGYMITNSNNALVYLQIFDSAGTPVVGTTASMPFGLPANAAANIEFTNGITMRSGIWVACTSAANGASFSGTGLDMTILYE